MTAATLDRIVQVYRAIPTDDGIGGATEAWIPFGDRLWALRQDISAKEATTRFHVRSTEFTRRINELHRIECDGDTFDVTGVKQVSPGRRQLIELAAVRRRHDD
jgi:head-tail adaptor